MTGKITGNWNNGMVTTSSKFTYDVGTLFQIRRGNWV